MNSVTIFILIMILLSTSNCIYKSKFSIAVKLSIKFNFYFISIGACSCYKSVIIKFNVIHKIEYAYDVCITIEIISKILLIFKSNTTIVILI